MTHWSYELVKLRACEDAVAWARTQPSYAVAWRECERGEWLDWLCGEIGGAEYERQSDALWAEYVRQSAPLWAKYERQSDALRAEYERQRDALRAECERQRDALRADIIRANVERPKIAGLR